MAAARPFDGFPAANSTREAPWHGCLPPPSRLRVLSRTRLRSRPSSWSTTHHPGCLTDSTACFFGPSAFCSADSSSRLSSDSLPCRGGPEEDQGGETQCIRKALRRSGSLLLIFEQSRAALHTGTANPRPACQTATRCCCWSSTIPKRIGGPHNGNGPPYSGQPRH